ncbi:MAG TPA: NAD(P)-dependent oxidoreductase [Dehalococcoidales bacterium]|nr:NAD(P)-dependent oxidoreductase [Dehalococcoidales bacterium]
MKIGFIGLGQMGRHMARRILEAGYPLTVYDINKQAAAPLIAKGAVWADNPAAVAAACTLVFSSLPTPPVISEVVFGQKGLRSGWKKGDIFVDMSTNSPSLIKEIAAAGLKDGVTVLDAPVSGGTPGADAGTLTIMIGGDEAALEKIRGPLQAMGKKIVRVGDAGCGNIAKLINNMISLGCNSISAEGFVLGVKSGIDPQVLCDIISTSTGNNWSMQQYPRTIFQGNFEPGFRLSLAFKDINLALKLGQEYSVPLPVAESVREDMENTIKAGYAEKSVDAVILPLEQTTGIKVRKKKE